MTVDELKAAALNLPEADLQTFLREVLEQLPVIRMNALVKHLEEVWDVTAAAPMMMAGMMPGAAGGDEGGPEVIEQTEFDVILNAVGESKLAVIKVIREAASLGIKEAKELVDSAPKPVKEKISKAEAEEIVQKLKEAGAVAELK